MRHEYPVKGIVDRALDPEAGRRYANAADMEAALVAWVSPPRAGSRFWRVAASAAAALLIVIGAATWSGLLPLSQRAATTTGALLAFEERDWVLLADFENTTGEEVVDGAIDAALFERELRNSSFVNIVPRERMIDALVLMQKPVETRLDTEVALEVAPRDGEIRAVVGGRVDRRGSGYLLTASVMNLNGATVASSSEEAVDEAYQALESLTRSIDTQPSEVREQFLTQAGAYRSSGRGRGVSGTRLEYSPGVRLFLRW